MVRQIIHFPQLRDVVAGTIVTPQAWQSAAAYVVTADIVPATTGDPRSDVRTLLVAVTRGDCYMCGFSPSMVVKEVGWLESPVGPPLTQGKKKHFYEGKDVVYHRDKFYMVINNPGVHPAFASQCFLDLEDLTIMNAVSGLRVVGKMEGELLDTSLFNESAEDDKAVDFIGLMD